MRYGLNMAVQAVRVEERLAAHRADLAYWQAVRARQLAEGTATNFGRHNVAAGDQVRVRAVWYPVRANVKTVTVFGMFGPRTTPWHEVQAHERRADGAGEATVVGVESTPVHRHQLWQGQESETPSAGRQSAVLATAE